MLLCHRHFLCKAEKPQFDHEPDCWVELWEVRLGFVNGQFSLGLVTAALRGRVCYLARPTDECGFCGHVIRDNCYVISPTAAGLAIWQTTKPLRSSLFVTVTQQDSSLLPVRLFPRLQAVITWLDTKLAINKYLRWKASPPIDVSLLTSKQQKVTETEQKNKTVGIPTKKGPALSYEVSDSAQPSQVISDA